MEFDYLTADPTGNITVLIRSPYTDEDRSAMIAEAFRLEPDCEQVGFVMPAREGQIRIEMMGYEFCGNACISAASWQAYADGLEPGHQTDILLESSGTDKILEVSVKRLADNEGSLPSFISTVRMPVPEVDSFGGYPVLHLPGISHMIIPSADYDQAQAESVIRDLAAELGVPALGMILYSEDHDPDSDVMIRPLVYVRDSDTLFWEQGCATGSTAIGYYRYAADAANTSTRVKQPGGIISISIEDGVPRLTGHVVFRNGY